MSEAEWLEAYQANSKRRDRFSTMSFEDLPDLGRPDDGEVPDRIGYPGQFPYTRGIHATGYRGRLWTMRQFAGFATVDDTNERFRHLMAQGQDGLSVAFDMPTLMGLDGDDPKSLGEVGHCGAAVSSADDMTLLFDQIPLDEVSVSMTINGPAAMLFAFLIVAAEEQGVDRKELSGTLQADMLKEYIAQKEWIYPPEPHMRLIVDMVEFCAKEVPKWNTISISGYHIREAGSTAAEELAFTLANGFAYVEACQERGMDVDDFAPRFSFFFDAHVDFFEEIAKFRAARRIWARWLRDRYGAKSERSLKLRFHTQTAGVSLTAQQPENNIVRTAIEALAAVLGGTQSLHTNALDEVYALPNERNAEIALRTQQVIADETGVADAIDPLGGSWYVEKMTDDIDAQAEELFTTIDRMGEGSMLRGALRGIDEGWFQGRIADSAYEFEKALNSGERVVVGVNKYVTEDDPPIELLRISPEVEAEHRRRLVRLRGQRDDAEVRVALGRLAEVARSDVNTMPALIDAARARATLGEMVEAMRDVFGSYRERPSV